MLRSKRGLARASGRKLVAQCVSAGFAAQLMIEPAQAGDSSAASQYLSPVSRACIVIRPRTQRSRAGLDAVADYVG